MIGACLLHSTLHSELLCATYFNSTVTINLHSNYSDKVANRILKYWRFYTENPLAKTINSKYF